MKGLLPENNCMHFIPGFLYVYGFGMVLQKSGKMYC